MSVGYCYYWIIGLILWVVGSWGYVRGWLGLSLIMGFRESLGFCLLVGWIWMYCVDSSLSGGCLMGCVLGVVLLGGIVIVCFALGWVVCINRALVWFGVFL